MLNKNWFNDGVKYISHVCLAAARSVALKKKNSDGRPGSQLMYAIKHLKNKGQNKKNSKKPLLFFTKGDTLH